MSEELKACPFCGGTEAFVERLDNVSAYVQCDSKVSDGTWCLARGPVATQESDDEELPGEAGAISAWNQQAVIEELRRSVAQIIGADEDTWPTHGNAPLAIAALVAVSRAPLAAQIPDGYALVPILPTPEMVRAAEEGHMPFGDMELAVRLAILSAPAIAPAPPPVQQAEPLYITHRPLIRNAINLLGIRRPVAPDVARVIEGLEAMLEGAPTPTHSADEHWLEVARVAEAQQLEQQSEGAA